MQPNLRLQRPLEDFIDLFETVSSRTLPLLLNTLSHDASLVDPYHNVRGTQDIETVFKKRMKVFPDLRYRCIDMTWGRRESVAYVSWIMSFVSKKGVLLKSYDEISIEGMSEILLSPEGEIASYAEFWGPHDASFGKIYG